MAAHILISINGNPNPAGADHSIIAEVGDNITCSYVHDPGDTPPSTYDWQVVYRPLSNDGTASKVNTEIVTTSSFAFSDPLDNHGSYLVRLVTDNGMPTQGVQYLRVMVPAVFGDIRLPAAGEVHDGVLNIPEDISPTGWANTVNQNVNTLSAFIKRTATSGRVLYVDSNKGRDDSKTPNDPDNIIHMPGWAEDVTGSVGTETGIDIPATHFGDFYNIQDAIDWAENQTPAPDDDNPWIIFIQPGRYVETLVLKPFIYLMGMMPNSVIVETESGMAGHGVDVVSNFDTIKAQNIVFVNKHETIEPTLLLPSRATYDFNNCIVRQGKDSATQGPALYIWGIVPASYGTLSGKYNLTDCQIISDVLSNKDMGALVIEPRAMSKIDIQAKNLRVFSETHGIYVKEADTDAVLESEFYNAHVEAFGLALYQKSGEVNFKCSTLIGEDERDGDNFAVLLEGRNNDVEAEFEHSLIKDGYLGIDTTSLANGKVQKIRTSSCILDEGVKYLDPNPARKDMVVWESEVQADTIAYDPDYRLPWNEATPVVDPTDQLNAIKVQDAIDELINRVASLDPGGGGGADIQKVKDLTALKAKSSVGLQAGDAIIVKEVPVIEDDDGSLNLPVVYLWDTAFPGGDALDKGQDQFEPSLIVPDDIWAGSKIGAWVNVTMLQVQVMDSKVEPEEKQIHYQMPLNTNPIQPFDRPNPVFLTGPNHANPYKVASWNGSGFDYEDPGKNTVYWYDSNSRIPYRYVFDSKGPPQWRLEDIPACCGLQVFGAYRDPSDKFSGIDIGMPCLVLDQATGSWAGKDNQIAWLDGDQTTWLFSGDEQISHLGGNLKLIDVYTDFYAVRKSYIWKSAESRYIPQIAGLSLSISSEPDGNGKTKITVYASPNPLDPRYRKPSVIPYMIFIKNGPVDSIGDYNGQKMLAGDDGGEKYIYLNNANTVGDDVNKLVFSVSLSTGGIRTAIVWVGDQSITHEFTITAE